MRIALVLPDCVADENDWTLPLLHLLVKGIATRKELFVFVPGMPAPPNADYYWLYNARIYPIPLSMARHHDHIAAIINQHGPFAYIHAFGSQATGDIARIAARKHRTPLLVSITTDDLLVLATDPRVLAVVLKAATVILTPTAYATRCIPLAFQPKVKRVSYGVPLKLFKPPPEDERPREYLFVGALAPSRQPQRAVELVASLPNTTLDIVGDGPLRESLAAYIESRQLQHRVIMHGWQRYDDMPRFYQQAKFLLVTADDAACCISALEAIACGTPVIGPTIGVLPEITSTAPSNALKDLQAFILKRQRRRSELKRKRLRLLAEVDFGVQKMWNDLHIAYESMQV